MKSIEMRAGTSGSTNIAVHATSKSALYDLYKQCPGDKFYMSCKPQATFLKFDPRTGKASASIPLTAKPMKIVCTLTKRALNGKHETKMLTI